MEVSKRSVEAIRGFLSPSSVGLFSLWACGCSCSFFLSTGLSAFFFCCWLQELAKWDDLIAHCLESNFSQWGMDDFYHNGMMLRICKVFFNWNVFTYATVSFGLDRGSERNDGSTHRARVRVFSCLLLLCSQATAGRVMEWKLQPLAFSLSLSLPLCHQNKK